MGRWSSRNARGTSNGGREGQEGLDGPEGWEWRDGQFCPERDGFSRVSHFAFSILHFRKVRLMSGLLRVCTAGSVDDGKSTLIGRLLHDSRSVYEDQVSSVEAASRDRKSVV